MDSSLISLVLLFIVPCGLSMANSCPQECSCFGGAGSWIVDCSSRDLDSIPDGISTNTTELFLQNNRITALPKNAFQSLVNLEFLYLHRNAISYVDATAFTATTGALKYITLNQNEITTLPDDVFAGMMSVKVLNLNDNKLKTIGARLLRDFEELVQVSFCNNNLTSIDNASFKNLSKLLYVGLSGNQLQSIPDSLGAEATEMYLIDYGENQLTKLPKIASTTRQIYATGGNIAALTKGPLDDATTLYELFVSNNSIETIEEDTFAGATSLAWLDLSYNQLSKVDDKTFRNISGLLGLYLTENKQLTSISKDAFNTFRQSVYRLSIDNCSLSWLDGDTINILTNQNLFMWAGGNPWSCDCSLESFLTAVAQNQKHFYDIDLITCSSPKDLIGSNVLDVTPAQYNKPCGPGYNQTALIACMCVIGVVFIVAIVSFLWFKSSMQKKSQKETSTTNSQKWTPAKQSTAAQA